MNPPNSARRSTKAALIKPRFSLFRPHANHLASAERLDEMAYLRLFMFRRDRLRAKCPKPEPENITHDPAPGKSW
jgi:hypothetical protein